MIIKNKLFSLIFLLSICTIFAQHKETIVQNRAGMVGVKTKNDFLEAPYVSWFNPSYNSYKVDKKSLDKLKALEAPFKIKVFMSVWCHDSKREVPRLFKILEAMNFDKNNLEIIALDRAKKTPDNLQVGFDIQRTPTFIFYKDDKEIARYVEHSKKSLEKDLLKILSGKKYKHAYE